MMRRFQKTTYPDGRPLSEQPKWRKDLPIDLDEDNTVARRDFTKFLVLVSGAFVVGQFWIVVRSMFQRRTPAVGPRRIASVDDVPVGGALSFTFPEADDNCLLVRPDADTFVAYNQICSHLSCAVIPDVSRGLLLCPCHNGSFDLASGRPRTGPPRRPLPRVTLEVRGNEILATGVESQL